MNNRGRFMVWAGLLYFVLLLPWGAEAKAFQVNARSAILIDMSEGRVLFEQNADAPIPPASITKLITLYLVFDAIKDGRIHLWDTVRVSSLAAGTGGSRMGLKAGRDVQLQELIRGAAVVSGNDACVALAEHLCGNVETFVRRMNTKARELGMTHTVFMTPNGLPANGQVTTARDISKLSMAYLRRFPESLAIHSMQSYTYINNTHHNANRLLGKCPGVDGLKTGFVCAAGYNITATAKRGDTRILAVVLGAPSAGIRTAQTTKLIEAGFQKLASGSAEIRLADESVSSGAGRSKRHARIKSVRSVKHSRVIHTAKASRSVEASEGRRSSGKVSGSKKAARGKVAAAAERERPGKIKSAAGKGKVRETASSKQVAKKSTASKKDRVASQKVEKNKAKVAGQSKSSSKTKAVKAAPPVEKKHSDTQKAHRQAQNSKKRQG